ncbi:MAG TPA: amidohydrolase family protein [Steroidobacteraceae bacterium]|nr:amidohydrolase family protein [Steroidobacteraceae bacterium]
MSTRVEKLPCEEAFSIPEVIDAASKLAGGVPSMSTGLIGGPLLPILLDIGAGRIASMDAAGVDMHVLSLSAPGVQNFDTATARSLATLANDRLADAIKAYPKRFTGLAAVAPQDPASAAQELERGVKKLGLKGAIINSHTRGEYLDDKKFWPILEAAEALDVPIYIHPREPSPGMAVPLAIPGFTVGWGFAVETGTHSLRLIGAGVFDRFPKLTIVIGHMGEMIPFEIDRIDNRFRFETGLFNSGKLKKLPGEYFRENFYVTTSGMNFEAPLLATIRTIGVDRVLYAIDHPYEDQKKEVAAIEAMPLSRDDLRKICDTNVRRVFKI